MEGLSAGDHKRRREEFEAGSPEAKRFLLDMLDDDAEAGEQDLASIMKSLEQEIALPSPPPVQAPADRPDLEFLLEASDDELGLPPPSEEEIAGAGELEEPELGELWGFDADDGGGGGGGILGFEGFECGMLPEEEKVEEGGVPFEEGLFEYADVAGCGSSDFADLSWQPETLPAV
ncbi:uncharacterized protein LOC122012863 [Zingiber officinale]|nr:uncharacterized protein LOC122012863 [Zingiber officinale]